MSLIPGVIASGVSGHLANNNFYSIATQTVGAGGAASVSFTSIPQTYTHLQLRYIAKNNYSAGNGVDDPNISFNTDTTYTNYYSRYLQGNGASTFAGSVQSSGSYALGAGVARSYSGETNMFGAGFTDIFEYTNTGKYKIIRSLGGADYAGSGEIHIWSGIWLNTAAITQIDISCTAGSFTQYTQFALYGVK